MLHQNDFVYEDPDVGRFRINIFIQRGTPVVVARHVHSEVKNFAELNLPEEVCKLFCEEAKGLFLVCGPAGNGKSRIPAIKGLWQPINWCELQVKNSKRTS